MKKVCAFLIVPLVFSLCGCSFRRNTKPSDTKPTTPIDTNTSKTEDDPIPIKNVTIYVSSEGDASKDGKTISDATTINHAIDIMNGGDTIIVLSGTYTLNSELTLEKSGNEKKNCELIGDGEVIFNFIDSKEDEIQTNGGINVLGSYWNIININVTNSDYFGFTVRGSGCSINNCKSYDNCSGGYYIKNASKTTLTNCISSNNTYTGYSASGFYIDGAGTDNIFDSCVSENNQDSGFVAISSKGITFNKCLAIGNGLVDLSSQRSGFVFNNKGHVFNNCIAYNNAQSGFIIPFAYQEKGSYELNNCSSINNHSRNYDLRKNINDEVNINNVLSFNNYDGDDNGVVDAIKDRVSGNVKNSIFFYNDPTNSYNYVLDDDDYSSSNIDTIVPLDFSTYENEYIVNLTIPEEMKDYYSETEYNVIYFKDGSIYLYDYLDRSTIFQDELFIKEEIEEKVYFGANINE